MLEAALSLKTGDQMQLHTSAGSPNFQLWTRMAEKGWMARLPDPRAGTPGVEVSAFELTDAGRIALPTFLSEFAQYRESHTAKMTEIFNGPCVTFTKTFRDLMIKSGATEKDFILLAAFTVARLIGDAFPPEARDNVAEHILAQAKKRLAESAPRKAD